MRRLLLGAVVAGALVFAAPASAYLHEANCLVGLEGGNGDNEIAQTYPGSPYRIDDYSSSHHGPHWVVWSWRWSNGGDTRWNYGECIGDDWDYVDRLINPDWPGFPGR